MFMGSPYQYLHALDPSIMTMSTQTFIISPPCSRGHHLSIRMHWTLQLLHLSAASRMLPSFSARRLSSARGPAAADLAAAPLSSTALTALPWGAVFCPPSASSPAAFPLSLARNLKQEPEPFEAEFDEDEFEDGEFVDFEVCTGVGV